MVFEIEGAFRMATGIILKQVGAPLPLIRYLALRHPHSNEIGFKDVCRMAVHLDCFDASTATQHSRDELMRSMCQHFGDVYEPKKATEEIGGDPVLGVFDEAVFEEFDKTEQLEFPETCKQLKQKRLVVLLRTFAFQEPRPPWPRPRGNARLSLPRPTPNDNVWQQLL